MNDKGQFITNTTYTINGTVYNSIDDVPLEQRKLIKNIETHGIQKPNMQFVTSNSINIDTVIDMNDQTDPSKKTTYNINGTVYKNIDDVPPEYREMIRDIKTNGIPKAQIFESQNVAIDYHNPNASSGSDHRDKFLREAVYPNLHLMDEKAIKTVMAGVQGKGKGEDNGKGIISFFRRIRKAFE